VLDKRIISFVTSKNPDNMLMEQIGDATLGAGRDEATRWTPGQPLKLLLAGYFGAGNVGSDMRSSEIIRQIRFLLGPQSVSCTALAVTDQLPADVLSDLRCRTFDGYVPDVLIEEATGHHGVVACEGSMFKSTFSNVLSAVMAASLGLAAQQGKLAVGYGAEVAAMDAPLEDFVATHAAESLILCRNGASFAAASRIGLRAMLGADTAWSFEAAPGEIAAARLRELGWNGDDRVIAICPSNPFWWPVRADPQKAVALQKSGRFGDLHYGAVFFHASSPEIDRKYALYLEQLAAAAKALGRDAFLVLVGMERVDERACADLSELLGRQVPTLMGYRYPVREVAAVLRRADLLISSRFHALIGAMPAGVPSIGIAMDERIRNLLADSGETERLFHADDPELGAKLVAAAARLDPDHVRQVSRATVAAALEGMGRMGLAFAEELGRVYPDMALPSRPRDWQSHLAPLPPSIESFLA
jgi:polysaccharide pyruvyl transferase WcaK-like protein